jgi:hypothetical protein
MSSVATMDAQLKERDEFLAEIRQRLLLSQDLMREHHNKKMAYKRISGGKMGLAEIAAPGSNRDYTS